MSRKKKKRTTTKKWRTAKKAARRRAKATPSSTKRAKTGRRRANEYESWTGAASTSGREIFDTTTRARLNLADYPEIEQYMPPISDKALVHFFVARVATLSKKTSARKEVVKLFVNRSWADGLLRQLEDMDFTKVGNNRDRLISDVKLRIDTGTPWQVDSFVEIFRDLNPPGKPTAKVIFTNRETRESISGFWCW